jgi:hypothetical protein
MSAFGGKADMAWCSANVRSLKEAQRTPFGRVSESKSTSDGEPKVLDEIIFNIRFYLLNE